MTRMVPSTITSESPPGEHDLFVKLRDAPGTERWVAFHSLNIAQHATQVEGEADFVVLVPDHGVLVIEVKSHLRVEADGNGRWKLGNNEWKNKSPFDQASGSMHSISGFLSSHGYDPIGYPVWHAVWFTAVPRAKMPQSIGWQQWALLDAGDLNGADLRVPILRVLTRASDHLDAASDAYRRVAGTPTIENLARIEELLEPRFVVAITPKEANRRRKAELECFTNEQVGILNVVGSNRRILAEGPAGSGKTYVAIEAACRAIGEGKRVLVVVFNRLIEAELKTKCPGADVYRIHALMAATVDAAQGNDACRDALSGRTAATEWYESLLPNQALEAALDRGPRYDYLVMDEAQDLAKEHYLDVLDALLVDGMKHAPLFVTGDFDHQSIYGAGPEDGESQGSRTRRAILDRLPGLVQLSLKSNVRSTPEIGRFVAALAADPTLYSEHRRTGGDSLSVESLSYSSSAEQHALLAAAVDRILSEPFTVREIVILSAVRKSAAATTNDDRLRSRLGSHIADTSRIRWGTIHEFKGMEAPAVILTDIDYSNKYVHDLLYVGASRATDRLIVLSAKATDAVR